MWFCSICHSQLHIEPSPVALLCTLPSSIHWLGSWWDWFCWWLWSGNSSTALPSVCLWYLATVDQSLPLYRSFTVLDRVLLVCVKHNIYSVTLTAFPKSHTQNCCGNISESNLITFQSLDQVHSMKQCSSVCWEWLYYSYSFVQGCGQSSFISVCEQWLWCGQGPGQWSKGVRKDILHA